nr:uncharacterized protein LOC128685112 [Cherax quadricarinatus]XP_053627609.1 uncharacterized protein LOC128685112 [Cherax quadricarinatus]
MWIDTSHGQTFSHGFGHAPALDRLCLHSRLGCVLAGSLRAGATGSSAGHQQSGAGHQHGAGSLPSPSEVSAQATIFVAVIVVFYAAIIIILLGTNMSSPRSSSARSRRSRSRPRCKTKSRHQLVLNPQDGSVSTQHAHKKDLNSQAGANTV